MASTEPSLRDINMSRRRQRILHEARGLITSGGMEGMNLRTLASAAEVTVPTIYNLIGNKEAVVVALFSDAMTEIELRAKSHRDDQPLDAALAVVTESIGVFEEDEDYYRAAFVAVKYLDQSGPHHDTVAQLYRWGERLITNGLMECRNAGLLRGRISLEHLGEQALRCYRTSSRAWAFGQIPIQEFRDVALRDVCTLLSADAVETFQATLVKYIAAQTTAANETPTQKRGEGVVR